MKQFSSYFIFRPLTPSYMRFRIRWFLNLNANEYTFKEKYFILHIPRQKGKKSCLLELRDYLTEQGNYITIYANVKAEPRSSLKGYIIDLLMYRQINLDGKQPQNTWINAEASTRDISLCSIIVRTALGEIRFSTEPYYNGQEIKVFWG